jgi:hypothetical protein
MAQVVDDRATAAKVGVNARQAAQELVAPRAIALELARCYAAICRVPASPYAGIYIPAARRLQRI